MGLTALVDFDAAMLVDKLVKSICDLMQNLQLRYARTCYLARCLVLCQSTMHNEPSYGEQSGLNTRVLQYPSVSSQSGFTRHPSSYGKPTVLAVP